MYQSMPPPGIATLAFSLFGSSATIATLKASPGLGRAGAFRASMLDLIDKGAPYEAHLAYWGPFFVVGEGGVWR